MSESISELIARRTREAAEELARAEADAHAAGKEPFDLARFEALYRGSQRLGEKTWRQRYYQIHRDVKTLAEFVAVLDATDPYEDSR